MFRSLVLLFALPSLAFCQYEARYAQSVRERVPFVIFVGTPSYYVPCAVIHEEPRLDWSGPGILIGIPRGDIMAWTETLPPTAGPQEVRDALNRARIAPVASVREPAFTAPPVWFRPFSGPPMRSMPAFRASRGGNC
jgi:hypothetical protein